MRLPALSGIGDEVVADATRPRAGVLGPPFFIARGCGLHVRIALAKLVFVIQLCDTLVALRHTC